MKTTILATVFCFLCSMSISAQTTAFAYQGSLKDGANPANGNFDFEFKLFDAVNAGTQQGSTQQRLNVTVANGVFAVSLDFGAGTLPGANRFLDIAVRTAGGGTFTTLAPRQQVNSSPYAVRSLNTANADSATNATNAATATNALQLGGVAANQYVLTGDPRMSDSRPPTSGSANYIQNQNTAPQASSNFNVSGTGTAGILNAVAQFNLGGSRILSNFGDDNLFAGKLSGTANTGGANAFFGASAGEQNTTGSGNSFFGSFAGAEGTTGANNSFFGLEAGRRTSTGNFNSFFGTNSGVNNTEGQSNSFFGNQSGSVNTTGHSNSFFGADSGKFNTTGFNNAFFGITSGLGNSSGFGNTFVGVSTGLGNTTGNQNSAFGNNAGIGNVSGNNSTFIGASAGGADGLTNANAIGFRAFATQSNSLILGSISGVNGATANTNVGIGTTAPTERLHVVGNGLLTGNMTVTGTLDASGSALTGLNAGNITTGTLNNARLGVIPTANGGTGLSVSGTTGNFLRSIGSAWSSSPLVAADIPSGSTNYIQNQLAVPQASSNFSISGNGFAGGTIGASVISAQTEFDIGFARILSVPGTDNLFVGIGTQGVPISGAVNNSTFVGKNAGQFNAQSQNSFFGAFAGQNNTDGQANSFFGSSTGRNNSTGGLNAFFGASVGTNNSIGSQNTFVGVASGESNISGNENTFLGNRSGKNLESGTGNTAIGSQSGFSAGALSNATAVGFRAFSDCSNCLVLGSVNGTNGSASSVNVGIGTTNPLSRLHVNGAVRVDGTGIGGTTTLCINVSNIISQCSSSLRYKANMKRFGLGLDLVKQFKPITFDWKDSGMHDLGLGAEDVGVIEPLLVTYNKLGQIEGVKYDRIGVVLINAVQEQQEQIEQQQRQIEELKVIVCSLKAEAEICKKQEK